MSGGTIRTLIKKSAYQDSVTLLALARQLRSSHGIMEAAALMGTPANKELLAQSRLLTPEAETAGANDLVIVIRADSIAAAEAAVLQAETFFTSKQKRLQTAGRLLPRTLDSARRHFPDANLAVISVPGPFAASQARKALSLGLHVMLFSDHVAIEDEVSLKRLAVKKGFLLMGPDCGTAILNGVPLGFANAVPRGRVGFVAASGTGLQQVMCLLAACGEGVSQAIGVGGRDMTEKVGGLMTLQALDALGADPATECIIVIGKPPAPAVRGQVEARLRAIGKPGVMALLGRDVKVRREEEVATVATLEDAAEAAIAALQGVAWKPRPFSPPLEGICQRVRALRRTLAPQQRATRGLYAGGTLAHEAVLILEPLLGPVATNLMPGSVGQHSVLDLGADEFTVGRAHPMLDSTLRVEAIRQAAREPDVAVLLLDVVLGHGAAPDPAGDITPAIEAARAEARARGRDLTVVASVIGTPGDPQGLQAQVARLEAAGAWVLPSNAQAVRAAACIAGGEPVLRSLLGLEEA
ncbi:MAG: acyl-CoA synthetase FdrA [Candidatus Methylomirabilales bacterium]